MLVAQLTLEGEGLPHVVGGLLVTAQRVVDDAQAAQGPGLGDLVADVAREREGLPLGFGGLLVAALPVLEDADGAQRASLGGAVIGWRVAFSAWE